MEIRKHVIGKVWLYGEYDFYVGDCLVASLRNQLAGLDYAYLYFLPNIYRDEYRIRIDLRYITRDEALEKAIRIVKKKLYTMASNTLSSITETIMPGKD